MCLPHLPAPHEGEVLDDGLAHVLQPLELHLQRLQLGRVTQVLVVLRLHPVLRRQEHLGVNKLCFLVFTPAAKSEPTSCLDPRMLLGTAEMKQISNTSYLK